jgi:release factor glutamine methyltransferase
MSSQCKRIFFRDFVFDVLDGVYAPAEDSFLLAENLTVKEGDVVLDMGTGCGLLAVLAAGKAAKVVATDINPQAIRCTRQNAVLNNVKNQIETRQGGLFEPIGKSEKFDLIFFNAPYLPSEKWEEEDIVSRAWAGGETGRKVIDCFILQVPAFLRASGRVLLVQSSLSDVEPSLRMFSELGFVARVVAECKVALETIVVIEAVRLRKSE